MAIKGLTITSPISTEIGDISNIFIDIKSVTGNGVDANGYIKTEVILNLYKDEASYDSGAKPLTFPIISKRRELLLDPSLVNTSRDDLFNALQLQLEGEGHTVVASNIA